MRTIILTFMLMTGALFANTSEQPNVLFILVDDMGWRDLSCYGNKIFETPNLDKLAEQGMRFTDAYAACPICGPFARSDTPGYANGGNKFDLTKWDDAYFARLKDFVAQAGKRGIAVEYTFFCPYYRGTQWVLSPFNPKNNINDIDIKGGMKGKRGRRFGHAVISDPKLLTVQQALVRKIVMELKDADNLYYEICNEAYRVDLKWQRKIAQMIVDAEKDFPRKHLIAQNIRKIYKPVHPAVSIYNYHPRPVNTSVRGNYELNKLSGLDETSPKPLPGMPRGTAQSAFDYRRWGWTHLFDGGAIYNNLDYSFTVEDPKGRKS